MKCPFCIKVCSRCGKILVAYTGNFYKLKSGKFGLGSYCKECSKKDRKNRDKQKKMQDRFYMVYMHISPSNKKYVGITCQTACERWHRGKGYSTNQHFTRSIEKYGWDNFEHIIIAKGLTEDEAKWLEIELIKVNNSTNPQYGYNISSGGEGGNGIFHTEEWIEDLRRQMTGEGNRFYGKHHTEETKKLLSELRSKKVRCLETNQVFDSQTKAAESVNRTRQAIKYAIENNSKCGGYHWEYVFA